MRLSESRFEGGEGYSVRLEPVRRLAVWLQDETVRKTRIEPHLAVDVSFYWEASLDHRPDV